MAKWFGKWPYAFGLLSLLVLSFTLFAQQLYLNAAGHSKFANAKDNLAAAAVLQRVGFCLVGCGFTSMRAAEFFLWGKAYDESVAASEQAIINSPADAQRWLVWLAATLQQPRRHISPQLKAKVIQDLGRLAFNEPQIRMQIALQALLSWYRLTAEERQAFTPHLNWVARRFPKQLWYQAQLAGRQHLLCRYYTNGPIQIPACRLWQ